MKAFKCFGTMWVFVFLMSQISIIEAIGSGEDEKIRLTDVSSITFHSGKKTKSRHTHRVPQLMCIGGSAGCTAYYPSTIKCFKEGFDGYDIRWKCKTSMDSQYRLGEIKVTCEGYDYPDDPHILKGSCRLEYTIDMVSSRGYYHNNNYHSENRDNSHHNYNSHNYHSRHSGEWPLTIITWIVISCIVYCIYRLIQGQPQQNNWTGGHDQLLGPPPPGFQPEYVPGGAIWGLFGYMSGGPGHHTTYHDGYYGPSYHQQGPGDGFGGGSGLNGSNNHWSSGPSYRNNYGRSFSPSSWTTSGFGGTRCCRNLRKKKTIPRCGIHHF